MPRTRRAAYLAVLFAAAGCGGSTTSPVGPTTQPTRNASPTPPWSISTRHISGRVLDEHGVPVPGAMLVTFGTDGVACCATASAPVVTDGNGVYRTSATVPGPPFHYYGTDVTITKAGYEDTHGWAPGTDDVTQDFQLVRPINITAGDLVHLAITPESSLCGFDEEFRCRAVHVTMPSSGTLILDTMSDDQSSPVWLLIGGPWDVQYPFTGVVHLSKSLEAGATALVQALRPWQSATQGFTLKTSIEPRR